MKLNKIIKRERERQGFTLDELAQMAGVGVKGLQHIEAGRREGRVSNLLRIIDALGFDVIVRHKQPRFWRKYTYVVTGYDEEGNDRKRKEEAS